MYTQLPFRLRGIHPDAGSEFINHQLFARCEDHEIVCTRSRPSEPMRRQHQVSVLLLDVAVVVLVHARLDTPAQQAWLDAFYTDS